LQAIVAYSFGGSVGRPGPSNLAFGKIIDRLAAKGEPVVVVVQDFIGSCVNRKPDLVVGEEGVYISTEDITEEIAPLLKKQNVSEVLLVAHPFLHWVKCKKLLEGHGFRVEVVKTGEVPFDPECENWWVRSASQLLLYGVLQKLLGRHGH
jgi:hypothetical protein